MGFFKTFFTLLLLCGIVCGQAQKNYEIPDSLQQKLDKLQQKTQNTSNIQMSVPSIYTEQYLHGNEKEYVSKMNIDASEYGLQGKQFVMPDSLGQKTYGQLNINFYQNFNTLKGEMYARAYLHKAKSEKDTIRIATAFDMLMYLSYADDYKTNLSYADSIITYTQSRPHYQFPMTAYIFKGETYYSKKKFKLALDNFLLADQYINKMYNKWIRFFISYKIANLKDRLLDYEEALTLYRENWEFVRKDELRKSYSKEYFTVLFALAKAYTKVLQTDSASVFNKLGSKESLAAKDSLFYYRFVLNEGINQYAKEDYTVAQEHLLTAKPYMEMIGDTANLSFLYPYLGKLYFHFKQDKEALFYLKKADTIFRETADMHPELRNTYELLIRYYERKNDPEHQLAYIKRLMTVDSILNEDHNYILKRIVKDYDTPRLLSEKEMIITALNRDKKQSFRIISLLIVLVVMLLVLFYYQYQQQKTYKMRFETLVSKTHPQKESNSIFNERVANKAGLGIPEKQAAIIMEQLDIFEKKQRYLKADTNVNDLARSIKTNSRYLSRVVNYYKKKNFSTYINDLRVDYTVNLLQTDPMIRKYTIKAIAEETGFNNAESFSKAFYKKAGIYPSYFIKRLEELNA